ncbi:MFS transporter [Pseudomonas sp. S2_H01]
MANIQLFDVKPKIAHTALFMFVLCGLFHFSQYAARSAPGVMLPELGMNLGITTASLGALIGSYYYTYSLTSVVAGGVLDKFGARAPIAIGMVVMAIGCVLFTNNHYGVALFGRLLQGGGAALAFTGAVYIATKSFPPERLASAIGIVQAFGMFGGSAGQYAVAQSVHQFALPWAYIWFGLGALVFVLAIAMLLQRALPLHPNLDSQSAKKSALDGYRVVFSNPQSWLCGFCAGFLFIPTTVGDMIWRVAFFTEGLGISYEDAVRSAALVLFGWVIGCPLLGWISDRLKRRKPVVIGGAFALLLSETVIVYGPSTVVDSIGLSLFYGIVSGAAMIPYTMIKEANPPMVAGTATGIMNLLVFATSALVAPIASALYSHAGHTDGMEVLQFRGIGFLMIGCAASAIVLAFFLKEKPAQR